METRTHLCPRVSPAEMETMISHANKEALPLCVFTSFGLKKPLSLPTLTHLK